MEIGPYVMSPTLESFNRPWMTDRRSVHLIAIEEEVAFYLFTYGFNIKRKNMKEKKKVLEVLIHLN